MLQMLFMVHALTKLRLFSRHVGVTILSVKQRDFQVCSGNIRHLSVGVEMGPIRISQQGEVLPFKLLVQLTAAHAMVMYTSGTGAQSYQKPRVNLVKVQVRV